MHIHQRQVPVLIYQQHGINPNPRVAAVFGFGVVSLLLYLADSHSLLLAMVVC
jgi:hypothetical protein